MARISVKLTGDRRLRANLRRLGKRAPRVLGKALFAEGEAIMATSKRLVPVDTGALRSSGNVQLPRREAQGVAVTLSYGGAAAPYAVFVHEIQATHRPPTQWKYLSTPFNAARQGMAQRLAARVKRDIERIR